MKFEEAVEFVLSQEGGYVNDPHDPGGETNFGISKRQFPELDIAGLTRDEAIQIYRKHYWDKVCAERLPAVLRLAVFDGAVNQGVDFTVRALQRILLVKVDGDLGPYTLNAIFNYRDYPKLLGHFLDARLRRYVSLPTWPRYGQGWAKRLLDVAIKTI